MGLRLRWTLLLSAAALVLVAVFAFAIELGRVEQVRRVQEDWERARAAELRSRLDLLALRQQQALRELLASGALAEVLPAPALEDEQARRALADWAAVESTERGLDEILVLAGDDRVITSARWPEGVGTVHPQAQELRSCLPGAPVLWRSVLPDRPREALWMLGVLQSRPAPGGRALVLVGRGFEGETLQILRADLGLDSLHFGPPRPGRGERAFDLPPSWIPLPGAALAWNPGAAPSVRALEGLRVWLFVAAVLALILVAVGSPWLAAGLGRPLVEMAAAVGAIGRGARHPQLPEGGPREIRQLRDALLQLTRDLDLAEQRIRGAERRAAWREIARRIAHEIRNALSPLALAIDNVETATRRDDPAAVRALETSLATARDQMKSLERLVGEFSSFARQPRLSIAPFAVSDLVDSCAAALAASRADVPLRVDADAAPDTVHGDVEQLRRAVHNLLKNAAEAAPRSPVELVVGHGPREGQWSLSVRDHGPGLAAEVRERLGSPYLTTKESGTGLGLPVVMRIVEAHGGRLVFDDRPGGGLEVRMELPLVPPPTETGATGGDAAVESADTRTPDAFRPDLRRKR